MVNRNASEKMDMNKKGIFFTFVVIVILTLFILTYTFYSDVKDRKSIQKRITTMNDFVFSVEKDIPRQLYISGFRTIFLIQKDIIENGNYVQDLNQTFDNAFFNGELNGQIQEIMLGATFSDIEDNLKQKADKLNLNISLSNPEISVFQTDPWNIEFHLISNFYVVDQGNLASWNKTQDFVGIISIESFEDPLYTLNTNNLVVNKIKKTPHSVFVTGQNVSNLLNHTLESYYISSSLSPSFLDKLQGESTANEHGIESLVNLQELAAQGMQMKDKSVVDYIYFSDINPNSCKVNGMPSWFRIDSDRLELYQVQEIEYDCS
ncbi:hypothetical protein COU60_05515 [Candidatus Pacearchaeota archaeon CG10_big_fil_rev_8_21_14_0_10_34_76]|nr:MAG: hypothetical protein COU60_05515 [Candidatus Pacearchaeota archaeon CG10_big_fil_rev_8_21_14_0_10_34_76]